jgi:alpha-tubulin suppressor-like RCC1 family protein
MLKVLRRSRRLARLAACTALALGLAGTAGAASAQARVTATLIQYHAVASWGANGNAELGDGTAISRWQYGEVRTSNDLTQVAAGLVHALAVRSDGTVWAWGSNGRGQLGDGSTTERSEPVQVAVLNHVIKIAAGLDFALALRSDGIVFAWGHGQRGQLGNGGTADSPVPVKIAGLSRVTGIAAGWDASLATENNGISAVTSVWAWGGNEDGQLGDGTLADRATPGRVTGLPASVAGVSAGDGFAADLGADGSVWDWGANGIGELGVAPHTPVVTRPVNAIAAGSGITQLAAGVSHMLALKADGTVLSWGWNQSGQLGRDPAGQASAGPGPVTGLAGATQVSAGWQSSYAVHPVP